MRIETRIRHGLAAATLLAAAVVACGVAETNVPSSAGTEPRIDAERMLADVAYLASDALEGRRTGTPGNAAAREHILAAFREIGIQPFTDGYEQPFRFSAAGDPVDGVNVVGFIPGRDQPGRYLVLTAHYDHLGVRNGEIFNGADDNASGTAAVLALARYFARHAPAHSLVFVATDAEEMGLRGAHAFVADPTVPLDAIVMNVNLDMVSRNEHDELYAAGTYHYPFLAPYVEEAAATGRVTLHTGHDRPDLPPGDDWTHASDHGAFHAAGIPFLYFGVEDHPDYHRPTDTFEKIDPDFYVRAVETVLDAVLALDRDLSAIASLRQPAGRPG